MPNDQARSKFEVALKTFPGWFACGFGSGLSPFAPGTAGTVAAIPIALLMKQLSLTFYLGLVVAATLFGIWACDTAGRMMKSKDPGSIVWDEMVGFWIAVSLVPVTWPWWLAAFFLFRGFDIIKPWPVSLADQRLEGGLGIMLDDVLAGLYTLATLMIVSGVLTRFELGGLA